MVRSHASDGMPLDVLGQFPPAATSRTRKSTPSTSPPTAVTCQLAAERIDRALMETGDEQPKMMDRTVRAVLRRLGGLPEVRGARSVFVNCPFARAWWREHLVKQIAQGDPRLAAAGAQGHPHQPGLLGKARRSYRFQKLDVWLTRSAQRVLPGAGPVSSTPIPKPNCRTRKYFCAPADELPYIRAPVNSASSPTPTSRQLWRRPSIPYEHHAISSRCPRTRTPKTRQRFCRNDRVALCPSLRPHATMAVASSTGSKWPITAASLFRASSGALAGITSGLPTT